MNNSEVYQKITQQIQKDLQSGIIPWLKPWVSLGCYSRFSYKKKANEVHYYSFLNSLLLPKGGEWGTIHQWNSIGGRIKKGSHANFVYFSKTCSKVEEKLNEDGELETKNRNFYMLRPYMVFHIDDVEGVEKLDYTKSKEGNFEYNKFKVIDNAEKAFNDYLEREGISFTHNNGRAFYSSSFDMIQLPNKESFTSSEEYYSAAFHEATHSTGNEKRLGRAIKNRFGSRMYAAEECVAELGSCFCLGRLGLDVSKTQKNSTAYIQGWLKTAQREDFLLAKTISLSSMACEYILDGKKETIEA